MEKKIYLKGMLELREKLYQYYISYEKYVKWLFRFVYSLLAFSAVAVNFSYKEKFVHPVFVICLSIVGMCMPDGVFVLLVFLFTTLQVYFLSPVLAAVVFLVGVFLFAMSIRFDSKTILAAVFVPIFLWCKVPFWIPVIIGLLFTPAGALTAGSGVIMYYVLHSVKACESQVKNGGKDIVVLLKRVVDTLLTNKEMYGMLLAFTTIILVTYFVRLQKKNYSFEIGVGLGSSCGILIPLIGNIGFGCHFSLPFLFLGGILSGGIAYVVYFGHRMLDYGSTEEVQFEDEDYYYYVRAVPKLKMTVEDKKVKQIYTNQKRSNKKTERKNNRKR